jgi:2-methylcitrate dehydratase PrpD
LKDGTVLEETVEFPRGSEQRFATEAEVVAKFEKLACHSLPNGHVASIRDTVLDLDKMPDISKLVRLLMKPSPRG